MGWGLGDKFGVKVKVVFSLFNLLGTWETLEFWTWKLEPRPGRSSQADANLPNKNKRETNFNFSKVNFEIEIKFEISNPIQ